MGAVKVLVKVPEYLKNDFRGYRGCRTRIDFWYFFEGVGENASSYISNSSSKSILRSVGDVF